MANKKTNNLSDLRAAATEAAMSRRTGFMLYLTVEERVALEEAAKIHDQSINAFIREEALKAAARVTGRKIE